MFSEGQWCCDDPFPQHRYINGKQLWHCNNCAKIIAYQANRINRRESGKVLEGDKTPTLESFDP